MAAQQVKYQLRAFDKGYVSQLNIDSLDAPERSLADCCNVEINSPTGGLTKSAGEKFSFVLPPPIQTLASPHNVLLVKQLAGSLSATTYYYVVTALDASLNESLPSVEVNIALTAGYGTVALSWDSVIGATAYRIYRGTAAGSEDHYQSSAITSFTDTGSAGTAATPTINEYIVASKRYTITYPQTDEITVVVTSLANIWVRPWYDNAQGYARHDEWAKLTDRTFLTGVTVSTNTGITIPSPPATATVVVTNGGSLWHPGTFPEGVIFSSVSAFIGDYETKATLVNTVGFFNSYINTTELDYTWAAVAGATKYRIYANRIVSWDYLTGTATYDSRIYEVNAPATTAVIASWVSLTASDAQPITTNPAGSNTIGYCTIAASGLTAHAWAGGVACPTVAGVPDFTKAALIKDNTATSITILGSYSDTPPTLDALWNGLQQVALFRSQFIYTADAGWANHKYNFSTPITSLDVSMLEMRTAFRIGLGAYNTPVSIVFHRTAPFGMQLSELITDSLSAKDGVTVSSNCSSAISLNDTYIIAVGVFDGYERVTLASTKYSNRGLSDAAYTARVEYNVAAANRRWKSLECYSAVVPAGQTPISQDFTYLGGAGETEYIDEYLISNTEIISTALYHYHTINYTNIPAATYADDSFSTRAARDPYLRICWGFREQKIVREISYIAGMNISGTDAEFSWVGYTKFSGSLSGNVQQPDVHAIAPTSEYGFFRAIGQLGDKISGLGASPDYELVVYKERSASLYVNRGGDIIQYVRMFSDTGCVNHWTIVDQDRGFDGIIWAGYNDIYYYGGGVQTPQRLTLTKFDREYARRTKHPENIVGGWDSFHQEYSIFIPKASDVVNLNGVAYEDTIYVYSVPYQNWNKRRWEAQPICFMGTRKDGMYEWASRSDIFYHGADGTFTTVMPTFITTHRFPITSFDELKQLEGIYMDYSGTEGIAVSLYVDNEAITRRGNAKLFPASYTFQSRGVGNGTHGHAFRLRVTFGSGQVFSRANELGFLLSPLAAMVTRKYGTTGEELPTFDEPPTIPAEVLALYLPIAGQLTYQTVTIEGGTAYVEWFTTTLSTSRVDYGTATGVYTLYQTNATLTKYHRVALPALSIDTIYYYICTSVDTSSSSVVSTEQSFKTGNIFDIYVYPEESFTMVIKGIGATLASTEELAYEEETDTVPEAEEAMVIEDTLATVTLGATTAQEETGLTTELVTSVV